MGATATVRKSDFIDAMEENQKDVRKMVMDSYHDIEKGKGRDYKEFFAELESRYRNENELRLGHIISTLDSISSDIKEIKQNQRMLYDVMSESQKMTKSMFEQQVINGQVLCDIRKSNQIMQYNQSQIANRMEHMHWLEEQKYLWG